MKHRHFDTLARMVASGTASRRGFVGILAGTTLSGLAAHLGLDDVLAKKRPQPKKNAHKQRANQQQHTALQAQGKHKRNGKRKHKKAKSPPLPPGCQSCGTCQMCQDGACVGDPDLWLLRCLDSPDDPGGQCHLCDVDNSGNCIPIRDGSPCHDGDACSWCQGGRCVPKPEMDLEPCGSSHCHLCNGGVCTRVGNGSSCTDIEGTCCAGTCHEGSCPAGKHFSCDSGDCDCGDEDRRCISGGCAAPGACCPDEWQCGDGSCVAQSQCCPNERHCEDGSCVSASACCSNEKLCSSGACVSQGACCPDATPPDCSECQEVACVNGELVCQGECECTNVCDPETWACTAQGCAPGEICMGGVCQLQCSAEFPPCVIRREDGLIQFTGCCWEGSHCSRTWYGGGWCCPDEFESCF